MGGQISFAYSTADSCQRFESRNPSSTSWVMSSSHHSMMTVFLFVWSFDSIALFDRPTYRRSRSNHVSMVVLSVVHFDFGMSFSWFVTGD